MSNVPAFLVAGTHSGVGKTTVAFTLMALLRQRGFAVQPFKIGPDFIDGGYHRLATGRDSINLDLWMMGWPGVLESFKCYAPTSEMVVLEGMGALFDGKNGTTSGSSAEIAKRLKIPMVLVVDIWGMTVTTGAIVQGILQFDPRISLAGIVLNRAGGRAHAQMVLKSLEPPLRKKVIGYLLRSPEFEIPERHLGLKTLEENPKASRILEAAVQSASKTLQLPILLKNLGPGPKVEIPSPPRASQKIVRLGVAKDSAFCFYYAENLRLLQEAGAQLVFFSPLKDQKLPPVDGLYLGGGYPESFSKELSANRGFRRQILEALHRGMPLYAECGGLMYLSKSLSDFQGMTYPMAGALPLRVAMEKNHLTIRYVEVATTQESLLGPKGTYLKGHEFHQSRIRKNRYRGKALYQGTTSSGQKFSEGFKISNLAASYIHLHFKSNPEVARHFVLECKKFAVKN